MAKKASLSSIEKTSPSKKSFLSRLTWEDWALVAITLGFVVWFAFYISSYSQLPGPVYGGDLYRDRAFIQNIVAGNPFWSDAYYVKEINYYPYLLFIIEALIVLTTGLKIDTVMMWFPIVTLILSSIIFYGLGIRLFKKKIWGLASALILLCTLFNSGALANSVAVFVTAPAFLFFWIRYEQENKTRDALWAGIMLGLTALVYGGTFLAIGSMFGLSIVWFYLAELYKTKRFVTTTTNYLKKYYLMALVALAVSMLYFGPLIIHYNWHVVNNVPKWGDTGVDFVSFNWVYTVFKGQFFRFPTIAIGAVTLLGIVGLGASFFARRKFEVRVLLVLLFADIISILHHLLTKPLFNTWFNPQKLYYFYILYPFFIVLGIILIHQKIRNARVQWGFLALVVLVLIVAFGNNFTRFSQSQWETAGHADASYRDTLFKLGDYMQANVPKDTAVLSNDEAGFMLASVSGRKVMITRRTHASYFVDIDQRIADAAVILYGNDTLRAKELLKQYHVKFLYFDQYLLQSEMRTDPKYKTYLRSYNVTVTQILDRYDIAVVPEKAYKMDVLVITPTQPSKEFIDMWQPVYDVSVGSQRVGLLLQLKE